MRRKLTVLLLFFGIMLSMLVGCDTEKNDETLLSTDSLTESQDVIESEIKTETVTESENTTDNSETECDTQRIDVHRITLSESTLELYVNEAQVLQAYVSPEEASHSKIIWSSSDESVATVSAEGLVKAVSEGVAIIVATSENGVSATCGVVVKKMELGTTSSNDTQTETSRVNESATLQGTVTEKDTQTESYVEGSSESESIRVSETETERETETKAAPPSNDDAWNVFGPKSQYMDNYLGMMHDVPGYGYTREGLSMISPSWEDSNPYATFQTARPVSLKQGVYLEVRVDDFSYDAGDKWFAFGIWDDENIEYGKIGNGYGMGVETFIRMYGNENYNYDGEYHAPGDMRAIEWYKDVKDDTRVRCRNEENDRQYQNLGSYGCPVLVLQIDWDDAAEIYCVYINGAPAPDTYNQALTDHFAKLGDAAYISFSLQNSEIRGSASCTILKWGTSDADARTPVGKTSVEPIEYSNEIAPIQSPGSVGAGEYAIRLDGHKDTSDVAGAPNNGYSLDSYHYAELKVNHDSSVKVSFGEKNTVPSATFTVDRSVSYDVADFPVAMLITRNFGACELIDGDGDGISEQVRNGMRMNFVNYKNYNHSNSNVYSIMCKNDVANSHAYDSDNNEYHYFVFDLTALTFTGRIDKIEVWFFYIDEAIRERGSFDICEILFFRNEEDAQNYFELYMKNNPGYREEPEKPDENETEPDDGEGSVDEGKCVHEYESTADGHYKPACEKCGKNCGRMIAHEIIDVVTEDGEEFTYSYKCRVCGFTVFSHKASDDTTLFYTVDDLLEANNMYVSNKIYEAGVAYAHLNGSLRIQDKEGVIGRYLVMKIRLQADKNFLSLSLKSAGAEESLSLKLDQIPYGWVTVIVDMSKCVSDKSGYVASSDGNYILDVLATGGSYSEYIDIAYLMICDKLDSAKELAKNEKCVLIYEDALSGITVLDKNTCYDENLNPIEHKYVINDDGTHSLLETCCYCGLVAVENEPHVYIEVSRGGKFLYECSACQHVLYYKVVPETVNKYISACDLNTRGIIYYPYSGFVHELHVESDDAYTTYVGQYFNVGQVVFARDDNDVNPNNNGNAENGIRINLGDARYFVMRVRTNTSGLTPINVYMSTTGYNKTLDEQGNMLKNGMLDFEIPMSLCVDDIWVSYVIDLESVFADQYLPDSNGNYVIDSFYFNICQNTFATDVTVDMSYVAFCSDWDEVSAIVHENQIFNISDKFGNGDWISN